MLCLKGNLIFILVLKKDLQSESILMTKLKWKAFLGQINRYMMINLPLLYSQSTLSEHQHCKNAGCVIQSRLLLCGARTKAYFRHKRNDLFDVFLCHCKDNSYMLSLVPVGFDSELKPNLIFISPLPVAKLSCFYSPLCIHLAFIFLCFQNIKSAACSQTITHQS